VGHRSDSCRELQWRHLRGGGGCRVAYSVVFSNAVADGVNDGHAVAGRVAFQNGISDGNIDAVADAVAEYGVVRRWLGLRDHRHDGGAGL
jgi:hypothetical protein